MVGIYLLDEARRAKQVGKKSVIITHHGVSPGSIHKRWKNNPANPGFVSDLSAEILETKPDLVIHGHTHDHADYMIGNTRIIANPLGYPKEKLTKFDERLSVEI